MESILVVETHVPLDSCLHFGQRPIIVEVDVFVLQHPLESLYVDIIQGTINAVHADPYAIAVECGCESLRGKLAALVSVEDRRHPVDRDGLSRAAMQSPTSSVFETCHDNIFRE